MNTPKLQNQNQSHRAARTNVEAKTNTGTVRVSFVQQDLPQMGPLTNNNDNAGKDQKSEAWCLFLYSSAWPFWPSKAGIVINGTADGGSECTEHGIYSRGGRS